MVQQLRGAKVFKKEFGANISFCQTWKAFNSFLGNGEKITSRFWVNVETPFEIKPDFYNSDTSAYLISCIFVAYIFGF